MDDLDARDKHTTSTFADNSILGAAVDCLKEKEALQCALDVLECWGIINGKKWNKSKCQIL